jgi:hypothetical protein
MLPAFDADGDLPAGVHTASLAEIENRFGKFIDSDQRVHQFSSVKDLADMAKSSGIVERLFIGGSFITTKSKPNDIDLVIVISKDVDFDSLNPSQMVVADRASLSRVFKGGTFDVIVVRNGTGRMQTAIEFFQTNRDNKPIGIVEVTF